MSDFRIGLFYPTSTSVHVLSPLPLERNPDVTLAATHVEVIQAAEAVGFDYTFLADAWGGLGPVATELSVCDPMMFGPLLAGVLIGATEHIKIITTIHQAWLHPLEVARIGANLDALSGGRWGMNSVSGVGFASDLLESVSAVADHDSFYDAAGESMEIILQAWHNDGSVDFEGQYFQAKGQLIGPSPVQKPHPLIVSAGSSPAGCEFAGRYASVMFIPGRTSAEMIADRREQIKAAARRAGRGDIDVKMLLHASTMICDTQQEADDLSDELRKSVDLRAVREYFAEITKSSTTHVTLFPDHSDEQLRELGDTTSTVRIRGDAEYVAGMIQDLRDNTGCDGISLSFPFWGTEQIKRFGTDVAPLLEQRGVWTSAASRGWPW